MRTTVRLVAQSCLTLCDTTDCSMPGFPVHHSQSLLKLMSIESVMTSNHLILCHPLLLLPSIFPSIRVFFNESVLCIRWPKYWSFSFSISPSNEYSELISFRIDWYIFLHPKGLSRVFSNTTVQKHQFFSVQFYCAILLLYEVYWRNKLRLKRWLSLQSDLSTYSIWVHHNSNRRWLQNSYGSTVLLELTSCCYDSTLHLYIYLHFSHYRWFHVWSVSE